MSTVRIQRPRSLQQRRVTFLFDRTTKKFSYDGAAWREILKRYPNSPEAVEARKHLGALTSRQRP
jgi:hypothetical protein